MWKPDGQTPPSIVFTPEGLYGDLVVPRSGDMQINGIDNRNARPGSFEMLRNNTAMMCTSCAKTSTTNLRGKYATYINASIANCPPGGFNDAGYDASGANAWSGVNNNSTFPEGDFVRDGTVLNCFGNKGDGDNRTDGNGDAALIRIKEFLIYFMFYSRQVV